MRRSRFPATVGRRSWLLVVLSLCPLLACDSNPFDAAQVPVITVSPLLALPIVSIAWSPAGAQQIRVYRGASAGDGYTPDLVWSAIASGRNTLVSPIEYGTRPPPGGTTDVAPIRLIEGQVYTVQITRQDPNGSGDGFTNTSNRYVGTKTFTLPVSLPNP